MKKGVVLLVSDRKVKLQNQQRRDVPFYKRRKYCVNGNSVRTVKMNFQ